MEGGVRRVMGDGGWRCDVRDVRDVRVSLAGKVAQQLAIGKITTSLTPLLTRTPIQFKQWME